MSKLFGAATANFEEASTGSSKAFQLEPSTLLADRLSSLLSSPDFSVPRYLNLALKVENPDNPNEDVQQQKMAELALQLQMESQKCHNQVEQIAVEINSILPRCESDVSRLQVGLTGLQQDATAILQQHSSSSVADENNNEKKDPLEILTSLYALQSNLSLTKSILSAASSWDATVSKIPTLLSPTTNSDPSANNDTSQHQQATIANLKEAVQALSTLDHGARALRGLPGREDREKQIADFRQSIQVLLKPRLLNALQQQSQQASSSSTRLGPIQQIASIYILLGDTQILQEEYIKARPATIHKLWFSFNGTEFATWLPGWYASILSFLSDERRKSTAVFGPQDAPDITAKIVAECFRPLLSSFQARLVALFPHDPTTVQRATNQGSLEVICACYEATLRFLSLAYDHLTSVSPVLIREFFSKVASPFASYQKNFSELEFHHSKKIVDNVSRNIRIVSDVAQQQDNLAALQDAVDKLSEFSLTVFPILEASLARYELLNCGYNVSAFLSTIDNIFVSHTNELVLAIARLSQSSTTSGTTNGESNSSSPAEYFDEQHVHCALEVLKISGSYFRSYKTFTIRIRDRFRSLGTGMRASLEQQRQEKDDESSTADVFDSMSNVEVGTLLAACVVGEESSNSSAAIAQLLRLSGEGKSSSSSSRQQEGLPVLLPNVVAALASLESSAQRHVFSVLYAVPQVSLQPVASLPSWRTEASIADVATSLIAGNETYSVLPQQYITRVGEHVLALVQALEPFASSTDALLLANEVMSGISEVAIQPWKDFSSATGYYGSIDVGKNGVIAALMSGKELAPYIIRSDSEYEEDGKYQEHNEDGDEDSEAVFCNKWLDVVCCAVTGRYLERILRVAKLTPKGAKKLSADLNYLINVFSALGINGHPHPLLGYFVSLVEMDSDKLLARIQPSENDVEDNNKEFPRILKAVEQRIAAMRGVGIC